MRQNLNRTLMRTQRTFGGFTTGQKLVAVIGTAALLLAGFVVFRWAATPSYAPLFSGLAAKDAAAVIDELDASGVPYQLTDGGATIMVPRDRVYQTRIKLSGDGLPSDSSSGYSILDGQDLSTSQFKEQTDFKRAMEGELARTVEAIDGVDTAVVHLAMPAKSVFAEEQDPTTASVLVEMTAGRALQAGQVQAVVNLVASSIDGLTPDNVTVADSSGKVLSVAGSGASAGSSSQTQQVEDFQTRLRGQVQAMLDRVVGSGNSSVQVTANLSFDKTTTTTTRYYGKPVALSSSETKENYSGPSASQVGGVVGPDGQVEPTPSASATADSNGYSKSQLTSDNAMDKTVEERQAAPGGVQSLHVGVVLDQASMKGVTPSQVEALVTSALGIDKKRGDTVQISALPFDRSAEEAAAKELATATAAEKRSDLLTIGRNAGLIFLLALFALIAFLRNRKRAREQVDETDLSWVEQLRADAAARTPGVAADPAVLALQASEQQRTAEVRDEIAALVGSQPEDVAALLRGWMAERA